MADWPWHYDVVTMAIELNGEKIIAISKKMAYATFRNSQDHDDLVSEGVLRVIKRLKAGLKPEKLGLVYDIARQGMIDYVRLGRNKIFKQSVTLNVLNDYGISPADKRWLNLYPVEHHDPLKEKLDYVNKVIDKVLTGRRKKIFVMFYIERVRQSEIAKAIGLEESSISSSLFRSLKKIRCAIKKDSDFGRGGLNDTA